MMINNIITINQAALAHNLTQVKKLAPNSKVLAMIKSDGYGHGAVTVANALKDADAFGVARLCEAIELREAGIHKPIILMGGFFAEEQLADIVYYDISIVMQNAWQLQTLLARRLSKPLHVWLKINTGMNRLGVSLEDVDVFMSALSKCDWVAKPINTMTHFSDACTSDNPKTIRQLRYYLQATMNNKGEKSAANSAAILNFPQAHLDWVRPGILLYGISPLAHKRGIDLGLQSAMTLRSHIIALQQVVKGEAVGYGSQWVATKDSTIAIAAIGYGDGYPWSVKAQTPVLIKQKRFPIVGRVSMDMTAIDIGGDTQIKLGDEVVLWGNGLAIEEVADYAGTIPYELMLKLTSRVKQHVIPIDQADFVSL